MKIKNLNKLKLTTQMKKFYTQPAIDIENVMVERGIATSPGDIYGDYGNPGQDSDYLDPDFDL